MRKQLNKIGGACGEEKATQYLKNKKYQILSQNYKTKVGEIDIVARQKDTVVFIEVKMRETCAFGRPSEAVNIFKQRKIRRAAEEYIICHKLQEKPLRFDVIELIGEQINHIENAF